MIVKAAEETFADKTWWCPGIRITELSLHLLCKTKTNTSTLTSNKEETLYYIEAKQGQKTTDTHIS